MLPEGAVAVVHDALGEALLLDARRGRGILTTAQGITVACRKLSNGGFTRLLDYTGLHLGPGSDGGDEFALYLTLRAPVYGHCGLTLKWKWPPPPVGTPPAGHGGSGPQAARLRPEDLPAAIAGDLELARLGVARHAIGPTPKEPEDYSGDGDAKPEPPGGAGGPAGGTGAHAREGMAGEAPTPSAPTPSGVGDMAGRMPALPQEKERPETTALPVSGGYNEGGGAGQSGGQPWRTGLVPHPSLSRIWPAAALAEREMFEMLGLPFSDHPGLTPLLIDEQFPGFPLRRDFTLPQPVDYAGDLLAGRHRAALLDALKRGEGTP